MNLKFPNLFEFRIHSDFIAQFHFLFRFGVAKMREMPVDVRMGCSCSIHPGLRAHFLPSMPVEAPACRVPGVWCQLCQLELAVWILLPSLISTPNAKSRTVPGCLTRRLCSRTQGPCRIRTIYRRERSGEQTGAGRGSPGTDVGGAVLQCFGCSGKFDLEALVFCNECEVPACSECWNAHHTDHVDVMLEYSDFLRKKVAAFQKLAQELQDQEGLRSRIDCEIVENVHREQGKIYKDSKAVNTKLSTLEKNDLFDPSRDAGELIRLFIDLSGPPISVLDGIDGQVSSAENAMELLKNKGWCEDVKRIENELKDALVGVVLFSFLLFNSGMKKRRGRTTSPPSPQKTRAARVFGPFQPHDCFQMF